MELHLFRLPRMCSLTHDFPRHPPQSSVLGSSVKRRVQCALRIRSSHQSADRRSANYQPTVWSFDLLRSLKNNHADEINKERVKKLEEEVRRRINNEDAELLMLLEFIDHIQRLGLGYRFENDTNKALRRITSMEECNLGLHATALSFRLLRQHGYNVSQDVFKSFTDHEGNFMACHGEDVEGMLSLYEASSLAFEGENLLTEAKKFSSIHLKNLKGNMGKSLAELVSHALELPLHHRMLREEARWYIEAYSKREDANYQLLELAKLDFNMVQSIHLKDLRRMSRWWKGMGINKKLDFVRDRLVECFCWTIGMVCEPQYSDCRKGLTKVTALITTIDDVYDVYGTLDELELFTDAVQRWDVNAVNNLPDYLKLCFLALYNTVNEMAYDTLKKQGRNVLPYLTHAWADLCKAFLQEARWNYSKHMPTFEEYLQNAWISVSGAVILVHAYFLVTPNITNKAVESLNQHRDLLRWASLIFRLCNDLGTSTAELERGENVSSVACYMYETGVSEEHARKHVSNVIEETWKKMNTYHQVNYESPFAKPFIETAINLARVSHSTYQYGDLHGVQDCRSKNRVLSLIIEPVSLV